MSGDDAIDKEPNVASGEKAICHGEWKPNFVSNVCNQRSRNSSKD